MRIRNPSQIMCVPSVTPPLCWSAATCLVSALVFSCGRAETRLGSAQERAGEHAEQLLEQLQRASPLQRAAGRSPAGTSPAGRSPAGRSPAAGARSVQLTVAGESPANAPEASAARLSLADAGVAEPGVTALPPAEVSSEDAGAVEPGPAPSEQSPDGGSAPSEPPRDIVAEAALPVHALVNGELLGEAQLWERLRQAPVTCFGELHNRPADHFAQTRALAEEIARASGSPLALGLEMFQRPFQAPLSAYVSGALDEAGLIAATEYETRWGYDFAFYRPLLEAARSAGLPALALNAPRELTRKIGRTGLESLDESEREQLPELELEDAEHREFIFSLLGALEHDVQLALENVYVAQTVWDETMAQSSASWLAEAGPDARLMILAGSAHCHESAIPRRLGRRNGLEVTSLAVALSSELGAPGFSAAGYDVLVVLEDVPLPADLPRAE